MSLYIQHLPGIQHRNVTCAGRKTLEPADDSLCDVNNKPATSQKCAEIACEAQWTPYPWGNCSAPCGDGGVQTREIACQQIISNGYPSLVDESECLKTGAKPPQQQVCNKGRICSKWHAGPWKPVSIPVHTRRYTDVVPSVTTCVVTAKKNVKWFATGRRTTRLWLWTIRSVPQSKRSPRVKESAI